LEDGNAADIVSASLAQIVSISEIGISIDLLSAIENGFASIAETAIALDISSEGAVEFAGL